MFEKRKEFLLELFTRGSDRHGLILYPQPAPMGEVGDFLVSDESLDGWVRYESGNYLKRLAWSEALEDHSVPYVHLATHTGIFAQAFGCPIHVYDDTENFTPASAKPLVHTPAEADRLKQPGFSTRAFDRYFELARLLRRELGPDVPISVPDIQSPFGIAAIVWEKASMMMALVEAPDSVMRLVAMAEKLLIDFLEEYRRVVGEMNYCHWPYIWTPPELGCWVSEDDVGIISTGMFEEFALPSLETLSRRFGGLFTHCCAEANHQLAAFLSIPGHRGMNRVTDYSLEGIGPTIRDFAGKIPIISNPLDEGEIMEWIDLAGNETRLVVTPRADSIDHALQIRERIEPKLHTGYIKQEVKEVIQ